MKLEASPIRESAIGMNQIQVQLENLMLQLQHIKKGKDNCENIWCGHLHDTEYTKGPRVPPYLS